MSLTRDLIQKFSEGESTNGGAAAGTQSEYGLSDFKSEISLVSNLTSQHETNSKARQKAKIINKKVFNRKLEDFHKQTFHTLLQQKGKQCHVCKNEQCKIGKLKTLPSFQMIFANVFAFSKIMRNSKKMSQLFVQANS